MAAIAGAVSNTAPRAVSERGTESADGGDAVVSVALRLAFSMEQAVASARSGMICRVMETSTVRPGKSRASINEGLPAASIEQQVVELTRGY